MENFNDIVGSMRRFGDFLVPYNFPQVPIEAEEDINFIKSRELYVDGYNLILHYNKASYGKHFLETLQVLGKYAPFLPFCLVCKIGKKFLGDKQLSLVEVFRDNRKIYCWTLATDHDGNAILGPYQDQVELRRFENFDFLYIQPKQVNFH